MSVAAHLDAIGREIERLGVRCLILDPAYLSMLDAKSSDSAGNLFAMGSLLKRFGDVGRETNCTLVLLHHFKKEARARQFEPPTLEEFSFAGFQQFARQWLLLKRRSRFVPGSGYHELYLTASGSSGFGGEWNVDIDEGSIDGVDFLERSWEPTLTTYEDSDPENERAEATEARIAEMRGRILDRISKYDEPRSLPHIRDAIGVVSAPDKAAFSTAFNRLLDEDLIVEAAVIGGDKGFLPATF